VELKLNEALKKGVEAHKIGQIQKAERLYTAVLKAHPKHPDANHNMGVLSVGAGKTKKALPFFKAALEAKSNVGQFWASYLDALIRLGRLTAAKNILSQAKAKGANGQAFDQLEKRIFRVRADLQAPPVEQLQSIINLYTQGQLPQALFAANQMLKTFPNSVVLYNIAGAANAGLMQFDAAIHSFKKAIKIDPGNAEAYNNIGNAFAAKGDLVAAIANYKQALKIKPDYAEGYYNMGGVLQDSGDVEAAIGSYKEALKIKPDYAKAHNNLGNALNSKNDIEAAIESYKQSVHFNPNSPDALFNIGKALHAKGKRKAAIDYYHQALKIKPDYVEVHVEKLFLHAALCDWEAIEEDKALIPTLGIEGPAASPFSMLSFEDSPERHQIRSKNYVTQKYPSPSLTLTPNPPKKPRPIRVGYFSADFHNHATMYLMIKVFERHNKNGFEIHAYSFGPDSNGEMRQRLVKAIDVFHDVSNMSDEEIALAAQADNIDIAVDLKGFTKDSRFGIFAYRPAPIQISHLGYPGTSGADFIDYIIADNLVIPKQFEHCYSERIIRLPHTYQPNDDSRIISDAPLTRIELGLPEQGFVFCCFNNNYKISAEEFDIWMRILDKVEDSVLWLIKDNTWAAKNLKKEAEKRGVASHRLVFAEKIDLDKHLARHRFADLFIDTFNVNAHTTTSDALWAGLPVVTMLGKGFAARVAGSLLTAIDLPELIVETHEGYEALIITLANNPKRLMAIKEKLVTNRLSKPLFDTELFTKNLEDGYNQAYQVYLDGNRPKNIVVPECP